jgi:hypothetical protein
MSTVLARAPLGLGPTLRRDLFERVLCCILTAATLAVGAPQNFRFSPSLPTRQSSHTRAEDGVTEWR